MEGRQAVEFQLRRLGKQSSLIGVKDVMKLNSDVTRFGRHSGNNFYLDSSVLKSFISRWHSEIHCVLENGETRYIIRDNSVNGTYVNNVRVKVNQVLQDGDEVMFGHLNGKNVRPGQDAPQDDSEFHFKFEKIGSPSKAQTSDPLAALPASPITSTSLVERDETPPRYKLGSQGNSAVRKLITSPNSGRTLVLKDISNTGCQSNSLVPLDHIIAERNSTGSTSSAQLGENLSPPILDEDDVFRVAIQAVENFADSDDDIFNLDMDGPSGSSAATSSNPVICTLLRNPVSNSEPVVSMTTSSSPMSTKLNFTVSPAVSPAADAKRKRAATPTGRKKSRKMAPKLTASKPAAQKQAARSKYNKWHKANEECSAIDCVRPSAEKVFWVQCDDCDMWFHTTCVGCNYDQVCQDDTEFKCGCL